MQISTEIVNCNALPIGLKAYGGHAGPKKAVVYHDSLWLLKYPKTSTAASPLSEYIGSQIYSILGYDTHVTKLGVEGNKCVVLCKDFRPNNEEYYDFSQILSLSLGIDADERMIAEAGNAAGPEGRGINLKRIIYTLHHCSFLPPESEERFWDMFVVDSFIGNDNRHNENWGFLGNLAHLKLSPIFDNGSSFLYKISDIQIEEILHDANVFDAFVYTGNSPFYVRDKRIDPIKSIRELSFSHNDIDTRPLIKALKKNVPLIQSKMTEIFSLIDAIPTYVISNGSKVTIMTDARKQLYKKLLSVRLKNVFEKAIENSRQKKYE